MSSTQSSTQSEALMPASLGTPLEKLQRRLDVKKLELNSLLEITQAINNNLPEDYIYRIYHFTIRANMNLSKLALFVRDEVWSCKVNFGTETNFSQITLDQELLAFRDIMPLNTKASSAPITQETTIPFATVPGLFGEFDLVIPIAHKNNTLAYVFVGKEKKDDDKQGIDTVFIQTLSNIVIVAVENKKLARQQLRQEALNREIQIAQQVQALLFPKDLPYTDQLKVRAEYIPHRSVGGDYFDFMRLSKSEFMVCIGDVSGKGIPAALLMSNFQASLRTMLRQTNQLTRIVEELNFQIYQNARGENFITFFLAIYNQENHTIRYINAGHNPPLLRPSGLESTIQLLDKGTTILGAFQVLPFLEETILENIIQFTLLCYTDGVTEVHNSQGDEFGPENLIRFFENNYNLEPEQLHERLIKEIAAFRSEKEYDDDVTLLTCQFTINNEQ
ncbi:MAG: PP2C family protein-serine/threonine phosphatase [Bacteroidota bacterium]